MIPIGMYVWTRFLLIQGECKYGTPNLYAGNHNTAKPIVVALTRKAACDFHVDITQPQVILKQRVPQDRRRQSDRIDNLLVQYKYRKM
jgi:hypothetical protein